MERGRIGEEEKGGYRGIGQRERKTLEKRGGKIKSEVE